MRSDELTPSLPQARSRLGSDQASAKSRGFGAACLVAGLIGISAVTGSAHAADLGPPRYAAPVLAAPMVDTWIVTLGANVAAGPRFPGSDRYTLFGYPEISYRRANEPERFSAPDDGFSISLLDTPNFRFGAVGRYQPGRYFGDDRRHLFGLRDVKWAVEPGAFVEYWPVSFLRARAELRHGINGHDGFVGNIGLDFIAPVGGFTASIGPRLAFGDDDFTRTYFGVTPYEAFLNGRVTTFRPHGGVTSVGALAALTYTFSPQWATTVYGGYNRLVDDAGRSPIPRNLGSRDQYTVGAKVLYSFSMPALW